MQSARAIHWAAILLAPVLAAAGQILLKIGASDGTRFRDFLNPSIGLGLVSYGLGTILWIVALSRLPLRIAYPFTALTFVLVYFAAVLLLGERFSIRGVAGTILILSGLALILTDH